MINKKRLPDGVIKALKEQSVEMESIISFAYADMNTSCQFVKNYCILTKEAFIFVEGQVNRENVFIFDDVKGEELKEPETDYFCRKYPLEKIRELKTSVQLRTGLLYLIGDSTELITYFTVGRYPEILQLVRDFENIKRGDRPEFSGKRPEKPGVPPMDKKPEKKQFIGNKSIVLRLLSYLKPHKWMLLVLMFSYMAIAACNLVWPYLSGTVLYDWVLNKNPQVFNYIKSNGKSFTFALGIVVLAMVAAKLLMLVFNIINSLINTHMNQRIIMEMRNDVFESMGELSLRYFQSAQTGTLMVRVLQDAGRVSRLLVDELPNVIINTFTIISTIVVMLAIDFKLALISFIPLPLMFWISAKLRPRMHVLFGKRHRAERSMTTAINDSITGIRVVKVFGKEAEELKKFEEVNTGVRDVEREISVFSSKFHAIYWSLNEFSTLIIWAVGAYFILYGEKISYGILMTFVAYVTQLNRPLNDLIRILRQWVDSMNAAERLFEIIDANPEIIDRADAKDLKNAKGHIKIENVTFGYEPNMPVLKNMSLEVKPGQTLGIVGRSGAGKTTLVNIISRLYEVEEGSVKIDGCDIRDISMKSLRKNIAMVSQETYIFMGTIAENIAYAKPDASREEIINAAIMASAHEFICKLPEGYDTVIGSSGRSLSGGERQRISIARAVLADPKILILDEATASVDTKTEQAIQKSLEQLSKNRTTLSIAHRLSTLKNADYLIVIEHGRIIEEGTHEELMKKNGTYCMLKELQTNALALKGLE